MPLLSADEEEVQIELASLPVSIQAKKARRDLINSEVLNITSKIPILFSGDVGVTIELRLSEQKRYESDRSADIDNVVKPILDALTGPDGVMIDDNQVQNVQCYWVQHLEAPNAIVKIDNRMRDYVYKDRLVFVHMGKQLYFPLNGFLPTKLVSGMLDMLQTYRDIRVELEGAGADYHTVRYAMPVQRYFHKTRLCKFRCVEFAEARKEFPSD